MSKRLPVVSGKELISFLQSMDYTLGLLVGKEGVEDLTASHANWVEEALEQEAKMRDAKWSASVAVGSRKFIENTMEELGPLFSKREAAGEAEQYELHDPQEPYASRSIPTSALQQAPNAYRWQ